MAKTLMGTGIRPERAYELARLIEGELVRGGEEAVGSERLYDVAATLLGEHENGEAVLHLRRLQALRELDLPIVLLVGGATGTGKSTVATEISHRLGITRVTSTDTVRQTMRAFFAQRFMPSIHYSSFEAGQALRIHDGEEADAALLGFKEQTRNVLVGVKAVIARALEESYSLAVEGVHLVPGALPSSYDGAVVVQCLLAIADEDEHARHFWIRDAGSQGVRPMQKYLRALPEIRHIQDYLVERAEKAGVPVVENRRMETAVNEIIHLVLAEVERAQAQASA